MERPSALHLLRKNRPQNLLTTQEEFDDLYDGDGKPLTLGDKFSDLITSFYGSWPFFFIQTTLMIAWVAFNTWSIFHLHQWDPYPFILMNLFLSTEAAFSAIFILMSNNRAAERDRNLAHDMRRTSNRAWSNTENIESLTEIAIRVIQEGQREQEQLTSRIEKIITESEVIRRDFQAEVRKDILRFSSILQDNKEDHQLLQQRLDALDNILKQFLS